MKTIVVAAALLLASGVASAQTLEEGFRNPPNTAKPHLWWHWMNGNVTKEGITADLEAMAEVGIGGAQIFDAGCGIPPGPVAFNSPAWYEMFAHAAKEANRLGIELCHANCSGWSSSGGPWITADKAMKWILEPGETAVLKGPAKFSGVVPKPYFYLNRYAGKEVGEYYRDIAVLAVPAQKPLAGTTNVLRLAQWKNKTFIERKNDCLRDTRVAAAGEAIDKAKIVDLTDRFDPKTGKVDWDVPAGEWKILRIGFGSNGQRNFPASKFGLGYEVDKLSEPAVRFHMEKYCEKLVKELGPYAGNHPYGLNNILVDSYEVGSQNWTGGFEKTFEKARGYSLVPYLPLLAGGYVVGSVEESERMLEDFRRVVADEFAKNYCGGLAKKCHELGLRLSVEPYGNCPADNLQYGMYCDIPTAECWSHGQHRNYDDGNARLAGHVAHAWGKRYVAMEAFTGEPTSGSRWTVTPFTIKSQGDLAYCGGVNRVVYHRFVHQPWKDPYLPGLTMGRWGMHYERSNTWWFEQKEWLKYQARCQWMLQEGRFHADILYYYGEGAPNVRASVYYGLENPKDVPDHYDYDQCARETVLGATVKDGRVVNAAGVSYAVLVLPPDDFMSLEMIRKVESLADAGAMIVGTVKPVRAPGLAKDSDEVRAIADRIWGSKVKVISIEQALELKKVGWDCRCETPMVRYSWTHRQGEDGSDWYFVAAQNPDELTEMKFSFPETGREPELWNPETGTIERARRSEIDWRGRRMVTMKDFPPDGSMFVVFRGKTPRQGEDALPTNGKRGQGVPALAEKDAAQSRGQGVPALAEVPLEKNWHTASTAPVAGPWKLSFPAGWKAPASITLSNLCSWTDYPDDGVRYFSGTATYETETAMPAVARGERVILDLGDVKHFAQVTANGKAYPALWRPPFRVDITDAPKAKTLKLEIRVTNLWPNRLIGDERECADDCTWQKPTKKEPNVDPNGIAELPAWVKKGGKSPTGRLTFTTWKHWKAEDELLESGLLGPVVLRVQRDAAPKEPLKVLMIGNSFSICVLKQAPQIAKNLGCDLKLCSMYIGGCSLETHAKNFAASEASATNRQYWVSSNYGFNGHFGIPEMLAKEEWDVVTIQQASHFSAFADTYHPWADRLIAGIRKYAPQAEIRVQQTWSYSKMDGRVWGADGRGNWKYKGVNLRWNQADMYESLTTNYLNLAKENGFKVIPMGTAVQLFRARRPVTFKPDWHALGTCKTEADLPKNDDPVGNINLSHPWNDKIKKVDTTQPKKLSTDSIHLSPSGEYLQGLVWVGSLFDVDPTRCTYRPAFVSAEDAKLYRECAKDALEAAKDPAFRLATYNVRIWIDEPPLDLPARIPRIAEIIVSNRFDIVGLEENCGHDKKLLPKLSGFASVSAGRDEKGEGEGMALLWLTNRFDLVSHDVIWLSETPHVKGSKSWNTACPRIALTGRFRDRANGRRFTYIVTHLDHVSSDARVRQMSMVMDLAKAAMKSGEAVFVAGDMNDTERPKDVDAKAVAERTGPKGIMGNAIATAKTVMADSLDVSQSPHKGPNETFTGYKRPFCRIDYIFVSPDIDVLTHETIDAKPNGLYASDHYPVAVDVRF